MDANDLLGQMRNAFDGYQETQYKEDAFEYLESLAKAFAKLDALLSDGGVLPVEWSVGE